MDQILHDCRLVALAPQLVIDAIERLGGGVKSFPSAAFHIDGAALDEPPQHRGYDANIHARTRRNFAGARRLPQVHHRDVDPPFGLCQNFEVSAEIFRVLVDQRYQLFHQPAEGAVSPELGDDDQKARVTAGQDLKRPDLP